MPEQVKENYMANMSNQLCLKLTCKKEKKTVYLSSKRLEVNYIF